MPPGRLREIAVARLGAEPVSTLHARADAAEAAGAISARRASVHRFWRMGGPRRHAGTSRDTTPATV
jgi:hypothetical protein